MKELLISILLMSIVGCTVIRETAVTIKVKDGQYGIAKGNGNAVYESKTVLSVFCKEIPAPRENPTPATP